MWPNRVVDALPVQEIGAQAGDGPVQIVDVAELLAVGLRQIAAAIIGALLE